MDRTKPLPDDARHADEMAAVIRVNQAGEYGAKRIYEGQLATLRDPNARREVTHMAEQEQAHLEYFNAALVNHRVRPTLLSPLWHTGGFLLGAVTGLMGKHAAMACTVAVESVIDDHYREQETRLADREPELTTAIARFRAEEMEHHATGLAHGAEDAAAYPVLTAGIRGITRLAIALSKRV